MKARAWQQLSHIRISRDREILVEIENPNREMNQLRGLLVFYYGFDMADLAQVSFNLFKINIIITVERYPYAYTNMNHAVQR